MAACTRRTLGPPALLAAAVQCLLLGLSLSLCATAPPPPPPPEIELQPSVAGTSIIVAGQKWFESTLGPRVCIGGVNTALAEVKRAASSGSDAIGEWTGTTITFGTPTQADAVGARGAGSSGGTGTAGSDSAALVEHILKH